MTAVVILGLGLWVLILNLMLTDQGRRLAKLLEQVSRLTAAPDPVKPAAPPQPGVAPSLPAAPPATAPAPIAAIATPATSVSAPKPTVPPPAAPARGVTPAVPGRTALEWLSENGLAWLGGGALALGGLFLVAFAAQHGFFTPIMRLISALILGFGAMGFGEWLRRRPAGEKRNPLVAALTTAAGAAILYATIWASYSIYGFTPAPAAAVLLAIVSIGLLSLAFLHGQPLGLLGVLAAFAVPAVSGGARWNDGALDGYLLLIMATGAAVAAMRSWAGVAAVCLFSIGTWLLYKLAGADAAGTAILVVASPAMIIAADIFRRRRGVAPPPSDLFSFITGAACAFSSLIVLALFTKTDARVTAGAGLATAALAALVALAVRRRLSPPWLLAAPAAIVVAWSLVEAVGFGPTDGLRIIWLLPGLAAVGAAGLYGAITGPKRELSASIGAIAAAVSLGLLAHALHHRFERWDEAMMAGFSAMLAAGAATLAQTATNPRQDRATAVWIGAAAAAIAVLAYVGLDGRSTPAAVALIGLALAGLGRRLHWRGFAEAAAGASLVSLAGLLSPAIAGAAMTGGEPWEIIALAVAAASSVQAVTWRVLKGEPEAIASAETTSTAAVFSALFGAFLVLRIFSLPAGGHGAAIGAFTAASLRTLLLLAAGLAMIVRQPATRWLKYRAPILLVIGAGHGLLWQGLIFHPWWGGGGPVGGPPILDVLALGLLAPALICAAAARRLLAAARPLATPGAVAALVFLLLWLISEVRRLFHGPFLGHGPLEYAEAASYAVALMAVALAAEHGRKPVVADLGFGGGLGGVFDGLIWIAGGVALWLLADVASPWWGPLSGTLGSPIPLALAYVAGAGLTGLLAVAAARRERIALARSATVAAALEALALLTLAVRYAFHGPAMRVNLVQASAETWTFSAVWALYGLLVLAVGARRRQVTLRWLGLAILLAATAKVFLFDMARLEGVIRAGSFLALGVLLLIGALAARRFGQADSSNSV